MLVVQRFAWQKAEDGPDPSAQWGKVLAGTNPEDPEDPEDPDNEDYMPIPDVGSVPATGKPRAPLRDWSDDDDCEVLEVYDPCPIAFSYPLPSTSADSGDQVHDVPPLAVGGQGQPRKRAATGSSDAGPSEDSGPPKKKHKKVAEKPRQRPTTVA